MNFSKILEVKSPCRANSTDAGIDFFIPDNTKQFIDSFKEKNPDIVLSVDGIVIPPQGRVLIPSGIRVDVPKRCAFIAYNKSGVSSKLGLDLLASVVDHGYQGQIHLSLVNSSTTTAVLRFGMKILQFILIPVRMDSIYEVTDNLLFKEDSDRGDGGFGSTGE